MRLSQFIEKFATWTAGAHRQPCVFIVGTGRSGTHLIAGVLASSPTLRVLIEKQPLFRWSAEMAADERRRPELFPRWTRRFRLEQFAAAPRVIVDKSHPNIWMVESLAAAFPASVFLGTRRGVHATVASMIKHGGFGWPETRWRALPLPNHFLGIEPEFVDEYASMSLPAQLAMRWISNERRLQDVRRVLGPRLFEVNYEEFVREPEVVSGKISRFLGLSGPLQLPAMKTDSIDRWCYELTPEDVAAIDSTLIRHGLSPAHSGAGVAGNPR
jgi:hypothetical protein